MALSDRGGNPYSEPRFPPAQVPGRGRDWYRGDCHVHSTASNGGELTPEQLVAGARAAGLEFLAVTEHNTADTHGAWGPYADGGPLVILGQEVTTRDGHWLALGVRPGRVVDWDYGAEDGVIGRYLDEVRRGGGLCVAAHPHAPYVSGAFQAEGWPRTSAGGGGGRRSATATPTRPTRSASRTPWCWPTNWVSTRSSPAPAPAAADSPPRTTSSWRSR